ncbi:MAG: CoA-binding protein, partial [Rhodothermales bacterium]|nr:CoA-binding protein [Rhodothermales bacterium]
MNDIEKLLASPRTIAVVGLSANRTRTSNAIARYMREQGFTIVPVNPNYDEVFGLRAYPDLDSIPDELELDIVNVFRRPQFTAAVVEDAAKRKERTGQNPV